MSKDESMHSNEAAEEAFQENLGRGEAIRAEGGFQAHFDAQHGNETAFKKTTTFKCSDDRIVEHGSANPGSLLYDLVVLNTEPKLLADMYRTAGIETITSHDECGAAKVAMQIAEPGVTNPTWEEVNAWAQRTTKKFCDDFGFYFRHITKKGMSPEGHMHPGTAIYVDYVGGFESSLLAGAEQGYLVSVSLARNPMDSTAALINLVAFKDGSGNAGDRIRSENLGRVFSIYLVVGSTEEAAARRAEADAMIATLDPALQSCIRVDVAVATPSRK